MLFRGLYRHLDHSSDRFDLARGTPGMVMLVFTLPSYDIVCKVIRDRFEPPKVTTRRDVMARYRMVFEHDRAGRLLDAQEFENLAFARERFSDALVAMLQAEASQAVTVTDDRVIIHHLYTERRVYPLDPYPAQKPPQAAPPP